MIETDWKTWEKPLSQFTGPKSRYRIFAYLWVSPYGDYNTNNSRFLFPVEKDPRLPAKERVHAIIDGLDAKTYQFSSFTSNNIIRDSF